MRILCYLRVSTTLFLCCLSLNTACAPVMDGSSTKGIQNDDIKLHPFVQPAYAKLVGALNKKIKTDKIVYQFQTATDSVRESPNPSSGWVPDVCDKYWDADQGAIGEQRRLIFAVGKALDAYKAFGKSSSFTEFSARLLPSTDIDPLSADIRDYVSEHVTDNKLNPKDSKLFLFLQQRVATANKVIDLLEQLSIAQKDTEEQNPLIPPFDYRFYDDDGREIIGEPSEGSNSLPTTESQTMVSIHHFLSKICNSAQPEKSGGGSSVSERIFVLVVPRFGLSEPPSVIKGELKYSALANNDDASLVQSVAFQPAILCSIETNYKTTSDSRDYSEFQAASSSELSFSCSMTNTTYVKPSDLALTEYLRSSDSPLFPTTKGFTNFVRRNVCGAGPLAYYTCRQPYKDDLETQQNAIDMCEVEQKARVSYDAAVEIINGADETRFNAHSGYTEELQKSLDALVKLDGYQERNPRASGENEEQKEDGRVHEVSKIIETLQEFEKMLNEAPSEFKRNTIEKAENKLLELYSDYDPAFGDSKGKTNTAQAATSANLVTLAAKRNAEGTVEALNKARTLNAEDAVCFDRNGDDSSRSDCCDVALNVDSSDKEVKFPITADAVESELEFLGGLPDVEVSNPASGFVSDFGGTGEFNYSDAEDDFSTSTNQTSVGYPDPFALHNEGFNVLRYDSGDDYGVPGDDIAADFCGDFLLKVPDSGEGEGTGGGDLRFKAANLSEDRLKKLGVEQSALAFAEMILAGRNRINQSIIAPKMKAEAGGGRFLKPCAWFVSQGNQASTELLVVFPVVTGSETTYFSIVYTLRRGDLPGGSFAALSGSDFTYVIPDGNSLHELLGAGG